MLKNDKGQQVPPLQNISLCKQPVQMLFAVYICYVNLYQEIIKYSDNLYCITLTLWYNIIKKDEYIEKM